MYHKITPLIVTLLFILFSTKAFAADTGFDASYYASEYPDVVNALGNSYDILYKHYIEYGINEGRYQNQYEEDNEIVNSSNLTPGDLSVLISPIDGYTTYIDVNIELQTVTYFKDGVSVFSSPCVTGLANGKRNTPKGTFKILTKMPGKRLKGPTWDCYVNRWMRFTSDSCGFHDASWRSEFGGQIYKTNGSHGCVNLPKDKAYELYDLITVGTTVVVH